MKAGWKTTEFWMMLGAMVLSAIFASGIISDEPTLKILGIVAMALEGLGYKVSRTIIKSTEARMAAKVMEADLSVPFGESE